MASARSLLLLGGALRPTGAHCMEQAEERGLDVILADTRENLSKVPELVERAASTVELPYADVEATVAWAVRQKKAGQEFLGVYGTRETAAESVAAVAEVLGLPGNGRAAVRCIQDKFACRAALAERGFRQPPVARCSSEGEIREFLAAHRPGPWIVKPPTGRGSAGVSLVRDESDLEAALVHLAQARRELREELVGQGMDMAADEPTEAALAEDVLVEGFQTGEEFSAEGVFVDGVPRLLAVTAKVTTGAPHFIELGHAMPADLPPGAQADVASTLERALPALGLSWGVFHVEFWLERDGGIVLGEVHVRPGGDYIHVMAQHITDTQMHGAVFDQFLGKPVDVSGWGARRAAAIRFLTPPAGTVTAVDGWAEVAASPHLLAGKLTLKEGSETAPLKSSYDRSSFVCVTGATLQEAVDTAERLAAGVKIEVTPSAAAADSPGGCF